MNNILAFIFTNYNNSEFTKEAVKSIYNNSVKDQLQFDIVIVDNYSSLYHRNILKIISDSYEEVKIIFSKKNLGYFNGLNEGINHLPKPAKNYDFVVIGNNDLFFKKNFINSLYKNYNLFNIYPVISPDIIRLDGFHQNPHVIKPISKFRSIIHELYFSNFYLSRLIILLANLTQKYTQRNDRNYYKIPGEIMYGYGACYILGPIFFKSFKNLLAPTFLMGEEFFLYYQLKKNNYKIYYEPKIKVSHHDHATVSKLPSKKFWKISKESHLTYKKYLKKLNKK
jgi:GT2 family glycosyltransferase